jgi:nucleotide-binding universal stress UspA family protein
VDFSESSLAALRFGFSLAEEADARITLLHVVDLPADDELLLLQVDVNRFRDLIEGETRQRLDALITHEVRTWSKPCTRISYGKSYREIVDAAREEASDLIVMGDSGRNAVDLTVFGSTTNQVVRMASCPVLTVRA